MPQRPTRRCTWPQCPSPIHYRGRCKFHQPAPWSRHNPDPDRPKGRAWIKLKTEILNRDNWCCYLCGDEAEEVDHKLSIKQGGARWDPANLGAICDPCHSSKSKSEALEGARRARERDPNP